MHRRWMSLPLLTSCVSAFYPYHEGDHNTGSDHTKRFIPLQPFGNDNEDAVVKLDIKKVHHTRDNSFPVLLSNKISSAPNALAVNQDGSDFSYFATMKFGSKQQNMYMLVDTGSANTWVMGQDCTSSPCTTHNLFGSADSNTLNKTNNKWSLSYGTGQVSGVVATDTVSFANFTLNMGFGLASVASDDFNNYPMDGIVGLGRAVSNELGVPTVMQVLGTQGGLAHNVIGIHLNRAADNTKDGELIFGGVDTGKFTGQLSYTQTNNVASWEIAVDDMFVNGNACKFTSKSAIIDTGTSYMLLPPNDAQLLHSKIPGSSQNNEVFTIPCDASAKVEVSFSGVKYAISPKDYVGKSTGNGNNCNSNIIGHQAFGPNEWILGDVFLKNVYTVFDFDQGSIGFGMPGSGGSASSSGSGSSSSSSSESTTLSASSNAATATTSSPTSSSESSASATESSIANGSPFDSPSSDNPSSSSPKHSLAPHETSSRSLLILAMFVAFLAGLIV